jgi:hypothetical protein
MANVNNKISKLFKENPQVVNMILNHGNRLRNMAEKHRQFKKNLGRQNNYYKFQKEHNNLKLNNKMPVHQRHELNLHRKKLFNQYLNNANVNTIRNIGRHYTYSHTKNELGAAKQKLRNIQRSRPSKISRFFGGMFGRKTSNV